MSRVQLGRLHFVDYGIVEWEVRFRNILNFCDLELILRYVAIFLLGDSWGFAILQIVMISIWYFCLHKIFLTSIIEYLNTFIVLKIFQFLVALEVYRV